MTLCIFAVAIQTNSNSWLVMEEEKHLLKGGMLIKVAHTPLRYSRLPLTVGDLTGAPVRLGYLTGAPDG